MSRAAFLAPLVARDIVTPFRFETQITMAARQNDLELGGYEFEFTSEVPDDCECPVCQLTIKDPIQILGCGHRLCKICSESLLR